MRNHPLIYAPLIFIFIFIFFILGALLFAMVQIGLISYTLDKIGVPPQYMFTFLFISIFGAFINIPIGRLPQTEVRRPQIVSFFGSHYVVPATSRPTETIIAVNVGGCLVPTGLSIYLLSVMAHPLIALLATAVLATVINRLARPIPGLGIAVPTLIPPVLAALAAIALEPENSAAVAYVAGSMGALIGADILNLGKIRDLRAPVVSIGGAGTFDGIFLTGIFAVVLATF